MKENRKIIFSDTGITVYQAKINVPKKNCQQYALIRNGKTEYSEFSLYQYGQTKIIKEWDGTQTCTCKI
jgi:hypothetical protein